MDLDPESQDDEETIVGIESSSEDETETILSTEASHSDSQFIESIFSIDVTDPADTTNENDSDVEYEFPLEPGDMFVSYENALILNENYKRTLHEMIEQAESSLHNNLTHQQVIDQQIAELQGVATSKPDEAAKNLRKTLIYCAPYFKDINGFGPPPNPDTLKKRDLKEFDPYTTNLRPWTKAEKNSLVKSVREDAINKRLNPMAKEEEKILAQYPKLNPIDDREEREAKLKRLRELKKEEDKIRMLKDDILFADKSEDFDWMKISAQTFETNFSPECCRLMWQTLMHPSINKDSWSREEDSRLLEKVMEDKGYPKDWDRISVLLDTGRTAFQCFHRFIQRHERNLYSAKWTTKEDKRLVELVDKCRINNHIPWTKVAYYMPNRTKEQCYQRWHLSAKNGIRRGHFAEAEDFVIIIAVKLFDRNWAKISEYTPQRGPAQIHSRYTMFISADFSQWVLDEDLKLLDLVRIYGNKNWRKVSEEMPSRKHRTQCRLRFKFLFNEHSKRDNFDLAEMNYSRENNLQFKRQQKIFANLDSKIRTQFQKNFRNPNLAMERTVENIFDTIDELEISTENLREFLNQLSREVPLEEDFWYDFPKSTNVSNNILGIPAKPKLYHIVRDKDGFVSKTTKGRGRPKRSLALEKLVESRSQGEKIDRIFKRFFKPSYTSNVGRPKKTMSEAQLEQTGAVMSKYSQMLKFTPKHFPDSDEMFQTGDDSSKLDIWESFQKHVKESKEPETRPVRPLPLVSAVTPRPLLKTYSRKSAKISLPATPIAATPIAPTQTRAGPIQASVQSTNPEYLDLVPPNRSSLVGLRGILLGLEQIRRNSEFGRLQVNPNPTMQQSLNQRSPPISNLAAPRQPELESNQSKHGKSQTVPDQPESEASKSETEANFFNLGAASDGKASLAAPKKKLTPAEADRLLKERFLSLFFWPGQMSIYKPRYSENLFEGDSFAASEPFDATDIINEAQTVFENSPVQRLSVRRPHPNQTGTYHQMVSTPQIFPVQSLLVGGQTSDTPPQMFQVQSFRVGSQTSDTKPQMENLIPVQPMAIIRHAPQSNQNIQQTGKKIPGMQADGHEHTKDPSPPMGKLFQVPQTEVHRPMQQTKDPSAAPPTKVKRVPIQSKVDLPPPIGRTIPALKTYTRRQSQPTSYPTPQMSQPMVVDRSDQPTTSSAASQMAKLILHSPMVVRGLGQSTSDPIPQMSRPMVVRGLCQPTSDPQEVVHGPDEPTIAMPPQTIPTEEMVFGHPSLKSALVTETEEEDDEDDDQDQAQNLDNMMPPRPQKKRLLAQAILDQEEIQIQIEFDD